MTGDDRGLRTFVLERRSDETGVSGSGFIMEGVVFSSGQVVIHWLTPRPDGSLSVWPDIQGFLETHVLAHPANDTHIYWNDGSIQHGDDFDYKEPAL